MPNFQKRIYQDHTGHSNAPAPTKRSRTAHACDSCRIRKSRCDGARPTCDICAAMGLQCHYRAPARPSLPALKDEQISRLESRLQAMESLLRGKTQSNCPESPVRGLATPEDGLDERSTRTDVIFVTDEPIYDKEANMGGEGVHGRQSDGDSVDGLALITFRDEEASAYFGPTSNSAFYNQIMTAVRDVTEAHWCLPRLNDCLGSTKNFVSRPASPPPIQVVGEQASLTRSQTNAAILPPLHEILGLVEAFFSMTASLFPYLHKAAILQTLDSMKDSNFQNLQRSQMCMLNMIMALACVFGSFHDPVQDRVRKGNTFLNRALVLLPNRMTNSANLETLQSLLLIVQYLQGTQRSTQTWVFHGAAVNVALQMGMQRETPPETLSPVDKEVFKRTWWMCHMMDRMCSMTLGRPPLIPNTYMRMPIPRDIELDTLLNDDCVVEKEDEINPSRVSPTYLFIQTSKLNLVLGEIIDHVYHQNLDGVLQDPASELLKAVIDCEHSLLHWKENLPPNHSLIAGPELETLSSESQNQRSRIVLTLRYLNTRYLLHRQVISRLLTADINPNTAYETELGVLRSFANNSIEISLACAVDSIDILSRTASHQELLPVWWISIYYAFSAALILFGALVALKRHRIQSRKYAASQLVRNLHVAFKVLEDLGNGTRLGARCQKIFKNVMQMASSVAAASFESGFDTLPYTPGQWMCAPASSEPQCAQNLEVQGSTNSVADAELSSFNIDTAFDLSWLDEHILDPSMSYHDFG